MHDDFQKRAEERRKRMVGGTARSFDELGRASADFWKAASYAEKLAATHQALVEAWHLGGRRGPPPRFDGSTWGILKFER